MHFYNLSKVFKNKLHKLSKKPRTKRIIQCEQRNKAHSTAFIHLVFFLSRLHWKILSTDLFLPTWKYSKTNTTMRYPTTIRNRTSKFFHLELTSGDMSYALRRAWYPDMVLTCPTGKEVQRYSFSRMPYKSQDHSARNILDKFNCIWKYFKDYFLPSGYSEYKKTTNWFDMWSRK